MNIDFIRAVVRRQHLRGVAQVEVTDGAQRLLLRIAAATANAGPMAAAATEDERTGLTVRSPGLGLLRLTHAAELPQAVAPGQRVEAGQCLAMLLLGERATPIPAPAAGVLRAVLEEEGAAVDYGRALFELEAEVP